MPSTCSLVPEAELKKFQDIETMLNLEFLCCQCRFFAKLG